MKVLHFFKTYYPDTVGGIEQVIFQVCEGAVADGVESVVLSTTGGPSRVLDLAHHRAVAVKKEFELLSTPFSIAALVKLKALVREVDVVHYHYPWPFMDLAHLLVRVKKPSVVTYHSDVVRQKFAMHLYQPMMHKFLRSVSRIVATSPNYLRSSPVLQRYADKTEVIPIGLDEKTYPVAPVSLLEKWRNLFPALFFLFVGVLRYYKGLDTLLAACERVSYPVLILGEGPEEAKLRERAIQRGIRHVYFLGALPDVDKVALLNLAHAALFPSHLRSEAFGISLLEAAMYGKPLVSCEIGTGTTYINIADETGLVIPPESPEMLASAMTWLMENPALARAMGERARNRYQTLFKADDMAKKYVALYERVIAEAATH